MGKRGLKSLFAGASLAAVGASSLVVGGAPGANAEIYVTTETVGIAMTCVPDPLTKETFGNSAIANAIAEGLFDPGPDGIRWTADDVPTTPMAMTLDLDITHPAVARAGELNSVKTVTTQDFGQLATDTLNDTIVPQLVGQPLTLRSFWLMFGSSHPRLGLHVPPPSGTTYDISSLSLVQTPDHNNAVSHGVPQLLTTGLTDASGGAEANGPNMLQVELADENDTTIGDSFYQNKGDRGAVTGFVVEPQWTDPGVTSPPAPSVVAPQANLHRTQSDAFTVEATVDIDVPSGLAGTTIDFLPAAVPVDFNLGISMQATLDGLTTHTNGRANFDFSCEADAPSTSLLTIPVTSVGSDSISGTVTEDGTGTPLSGISVRLLDSGFNLIEKVTTDVNGDYAFTAADGTNTYHLKFVDITGSHLPEYNSNAATRFTSTGVTGFTAATVDASLAAASIGTVAGTVVEDGTGDPLPGISVRLLTSDGTFVATRNSKADGSFRFADFPPGDYIIRFIDLDDSHVDEFHADKTTRFNADPFTLPKSTAMQPGVVIDGSLAVTIP